MGCARIDERALRGEFKGLIRLREGDDDFFSFHVQLMMWKRQAKAMAPLLIILLV